MEERGRVEFLDAGLALLRSRVAALLTSLPMDEAMIRATRRLGGPLPPLEEIWPDPDDMANDVTRYLVEAPLADFEGAGIATAIDHLHTLTSTAERNRFVHRLCRVTSELDPLGGPVSQATTRRHFLSMFLIALPVDSLQRKALISEALEDHYVSHRQLFTEVVTAPLVDAARQHPDPTLFGNRPEELPFDLFAILSSAVREGLHSRRFLDPVSAQVELPSGPEGASEEWDPLGLAYLAFHQAIFVALEDANSDTPPDVRPRARSASSHQPPADDSPIKEALLEGMLEQAQLMLRDILERGVTPGEVVAERPDLAEVALQWAHDDEFRTDLHAWATRPAVQRWVTDEASEELRDLWGPHGRSPRSLQRTSLAFGTGIASDPVRHDGFIRSLPFLAATPPTLSGRQPPERLTTIMEDAVIKGRQSAVDAYQQHFEAVGVTPSPAFFAPGQHDLAFDVFSTLCTAVFDGLALRQPFDPACEQFELTTEGRSVTWSPAAFGVYALAKLFFGPFDES